MNTMILQKTRHPLKYISQLLLTVPLISFTGFTEEVPISSIISNGEAEKASNKTSNVWLTVDDSLSMGIMGHLPYYAKGDTRTRTLIMKNCGPKKVPQRTPWGSIHPDYNRSVCHNKAHGYSGGIVRYDPAFPYEDNIPVDHEGNQLPLPDKVDETYKQNPTEGDKFTYNPHDPNRDRSRHFWFNHRNPIDPFIYYAVKNMGVKYRPSYTKLNDRNSVPFISPTVTLETIKINKTVKPRWAWLPHPSGGNYYNGALLTDEDTCDLATNKRRCQVWVTYYRTKMLATKSALSIAMYKHKNADFRLGYTDLLKHSPNFSWHGSSAWHYWRAKKASPYLDKSKAENWSGDDRYDTPYIRRSQLFPLRQNNDEVRENFYKWLFSIAPVNPGTSTRETTTYLFKKIKQYAKTKANSGNSKSHTSIWLEDMTKPYSKKDNREYTCRLNHNIIFTDGAWGTTTESRTVENMTAFNGNSISTEASVTLPDGKIYSPSAAYAKAYRASPGILSLPSNITSCDSQTEACWKAEKKWIHGQNKAGGKRMTGMADIAFQGWATDLDGDTSNNRAGDVGALVLPNDEQKKYIDKHGNKIIYKNNGSEYWSHFNDPAAWQHINTHMIGFNLKKRHDRFKTLYINAPKTTDEAKALDKNVTHGEIGLNAFQGGNETWVRAKINSDFFAGSNQLSDAARTAITGRGMYFNAQGADEVIEAFDRIFSRIETAGKAGPPPSAGSGGTAGGSQTLDNSYYLTRYDIKPFTGELIKYRLFDGNRSSTVACFNRTYGSTDTLPLPGTPCTTKPLWNAAVNLNKRNWNGRHILTRKRQKVGSSSATDLTAANMSGNDLTVDKLSYKTLDFMPNTISPAQKSRLINGFSPILSANFSDNEKRLKKLFNYVKGDKEQETAGLFKNRNKHNYADGEARNILGAIMRSKPTFVGIPTAYINHLDPTNAVEKRVRENYLALIDDFINNNKNNEREMLYVGANDGMLHAFDKDGQEAFAYVPSAVYDKLPKLVETNKTEVSLVDGNIDVQMVYFGEKWHRALVAGMGGGAKGLFALNVTPKTGEDIPTANSVKDSKIINWEYGDLESKLFQRKAQNLPATAPLPKSNIGNILAQPAIIQLQDDNWVAIVGNGYNAESNKAAVIVINLKTGKPIQELVLDTNDKYSDSDEPNGLGPLYFISYPSKNRTESNQYDRAYAGDLQGNVWVFDLTNSNITDGIKVIHRKPADKGSGTPLFTAKDKDGKRQPITVYPLVRQHPLNYGYLVHFGTGSLFEEHDLSTKVNNSIYAIWDDWVEEDKGGLPITTNNRTTVKISQLNEVELLTKTVTVKDSNGAPVTKNIRYLNTADNKATDWALKNADLGTKHRGWHIKLSEDERAWQPAFLSYGNSHPKNTMGIAYNTVKYGKDNVPDNSCVISGIRANSWQLAFNTSDAARSLDSAGVLDINADGSVGVRDKQIKNSKGKFVDVMSVLSVGALSGLGNTGSVLFNAPAQTVQKLNASSTATRGSRDNICYSVVQMMLDSSGKLMPKTVERCSYFSSWLELK